MSAVLLDIIIYVLIIVGVGFGGIGVIGLLLFPDIRSRMFTGRRATLISCCAIFLAGIIFSIFNLFTRGGTQYTTFIVYAVLFLIIIVFLNQVAARVILKQTSKMNYVLPSDTIESGEKPDFAEKE